MLFDCSGNGGGGGGGDEGSGSDSAHNYHGFMFVGTERRRCQYFLQ